MAKRPEKRGPRGSRCHWTFSFSESYNVTRKQRLAEARNILLEAEGTDQLVGVLTGKYEQLRKRVRLLNLEPEIAEILASENAIVAAVTGVVRGPFLEYLGMSTDLRARHGTAKAKCRGEEGASRKVDSPERLATRFKCDGKKQTVTFDGKAVPFQRKNEANGRPKWPDQPFRLIHYLRQEGGQCAKTAAYKKAYGHPEVKADFNQDLRRKKQEVVDALKLAGLNVTIKLDDKSDGTMWLANRK